MIRKKIYRYIVGAFLSVLCAGLALPQEMVMPVQGASENSYDRQSFWYYPWGKSVTHKGVDIFAKKGTNVRPATWGWVIYAGKMGRGGNVVCVLGPKWRVHYYAHLDQFSAEEGSFVTQADVIGKVGNTGNAQGKPAHLHYSIFTVLPYPWRIDHSHHGYLKMFYLNPIEYLQ